MNAEDLVIIFKKNMANTQQNRAPPRNRIRQGRDTRGDVR